MKKTYFFIALLVMLVCSNNVLNAQCDPVLRPDSVQVLFGNGTIFETSQLGNTMYAVGSFEKISKPTGAFSKIDANSGKSLINTSLWAKIDANLSNGYSVLAATDDGNGGAIVAGQFISVDGNTRNNIARFNANGQLTSWNPNPNGMIWGLYRSGNIIYVAGSFTNISGQTRNRLAAYDLTTGNLTAWNPDCSADVYAMTGSGNNIYVGGNFSSVGGQLRSRVAVLSGITGLATTWNCNVGLGHVATLAVDNNTLYVGGLFSTVGGQPRANVAAIDLTTAAVSSWAPNPNAKVHGITPNGSNVFLGGEFTTAGSQPRNYFAEINSTGAATSTNLSLPVATGNLVHSIKPYGSSFFVCGYFTLSTGQKSIAKYDMTTKALEIAWESNVDGAVRITYNIGTSLFLGGAFSEYYKTQKYAAAYDLVGDTLLPWNPKLSNFGYAVAATNQGIYLGGDFGSVNGITRSKIACVDPITATPNSWNPDANSSVQKLHVNGNTLYVGGDFTMFGTNTRHHIAAFDLASGALTSWDPAADGTVFDIIVDGGIAYMAGSFNNLGGTRKRLAAVPVNSNIANSWNPIINSGSVIALAKSGNTIYAAGQFQHTATVPIVRNLAAINATTGVISATWTPQPSTNINAILADGNRLYVLGGGAFASLNTTTGTATSWAPTPWGGLWIGKHNDVLWAGTYQYQLKETNPIVNISGPTTICGSVPETYTAHTLATGASFQWKKNNINVGTNSSTYTAILSANDQIHVVMTVPGGSCYTSSTATSNTIIVGMSPSAITPVVSVSGTNPVCIGSNGTYTAASNVTGASLQWKVNNTNMGTNNSIYSYTPVNGDVVTVVATMPLIGCYSTPTVTSSPFPVVVSPPTSATISISTPSTDVCSGIPITFSSTSNVTGGSYEWKVNGITILGVNTSSYTYNPANGDNISCIVTAPVGSCHTTFTGTSNTVSMVVRPSTTVPTLSVAMHRTQICAGEVVNYTATTNIPGASYQWRVNGNIAGSNSSTYTYSPSTGDQVTCTAIVPMNVCSSLPSVTSAPAIAQVATAVVPNVSILATPSGAVCEGTTINLVCNTNIANGVYNWKVNGVSVGNTATYSYAPQNGDLVFCTVTKTNGCYSAPYAVSMAMPIQVNTKTPVPLSLSAMHIAEVGTTVTISASIPADLTNYTINWKNNGNTFAITTAATTSYTKTAGNDVINATITPNDGCYKEGSALDITIYSVGVSVNNIYYKSGIEMFPNPFKDRITVKGATSSDKIIVLDMIGRIITPSIITSTSGTLAIFNDIAPGVYVLKLVDAEGNIKVNLPIRKL